jgi:hypothetical protein
MVALTQLLYEQTEAELSLVVAVVKSGTVQEALFWAGELHGSGLHDRVWEVIWYIYYDFFAIHHPLLGQHLQMFHEEYREGPALTPLAHAVYNLAIRTPRTEIFEARIHSQQHCPIPCRTFKDLADLWTHGSLLEIGAFLSSTDLSTDTLTDSVKFAFPAQIAPPAVDEMVPREITVLALVGSARLPSNEHAHTFLSIDAPEEIIDAMSDIGSFEDTTDYYYLSDRRVWGTTKRLGCFDLPRYNLRKPLTEHLWFHWGYHACQTPLWRDRFARYKGVPNHKTHEIDFPDEDTEEEFFQTWNVLPDEQSTRVQELASGQIVMVPYSRWFRETFGKAACITPTDPILYIPRN